MSLSCLEPPSPKVWSLLDRDIHQLESHCILQLSVERRCVFWSVVPSEYSHAHHGGGWQWYLWVMSFWLQRFSFEDCELTSDVAVEYDEDD